MFGRRTSVGFVDEANGTIVVDADILLPLGDCPLVARFSTTGSTVHAGERLPVFSWDRVPVSVHFGIGEGLESEQYDFVAKHFNGNVLEA